MLGVVGSNLTIFKFEPTTPNMVAKRTQHVGPTMLRHVALACCDHLAGALGNLIGSFSNEDGDGGDEAL